MNNRAAGIECGAGGGVRVATLGCAVQAGAVQAGVLQPGVARAGSVQASAAEGPGQRWKAGFAISAAARSQCQVVELPAGARRGELIVTTGFLSVSLNGRHREFASVMVTYCLMH